MSENESLKTIATEIKKISGILASMFDDSVLTDNERKLIAVINEEKLKCNKLYQENVYLKSKLKQYVDCKPTDTN